jgi:hypothetical protein
MGRRLALLRHQYFMVVLPWDVRFSDGGAYTDTKFDNAFSVRAVRGGS